MENKLKQMQIFTVKLVSKVQVCHDILTLKFAIPENFSWTEGTHFHLALKDFKFEDNPDKSKVRTLSIISNPKEGYLGVTTRVSKNCSEYKQKLMNLVAGDEMFMFKIGARMQLKRLNRPIVLISMGVGLATMRNLIFSYNENPEAIPKLISINIDSAENKLYKEEIDALNVSNFTNLYTINRAELYSKIDECLEKYNALYYVVGSDEFLMNVTKYLLDNKVKDENIVIDKKADKRAEIIKIS
jgi:ferredoxin--NADP+ reductase